MHKFKRTQFGALSDDLAGYSLEEIILDLKTYCRSAASNFDVKVNPKISTDMMKHCQRLIGYSFREFIDANYNNQLSRQSELMKSIVRYVSGKGTHNQVRTQLVINQNTILQRVNKTINYVHDPASNLQNKELEGLRSVTNRDFFKLIECLGPLDTARLFLMLTGETENVIPK